MNATAAAAAKAFVSKRHKPLTLSLCPMVLMTASELYRRLSTLSERFAARDLQEYLLALLALCAENASQPMSGELLIALLEQAFSAPLAAKPQQCLAFLPLPDDALAETDAYAYSRAVLLFQIAELHSMRGKQLNDEQRYFGITSDSGHRWYNFDPFSLLECGAACLLDSGSESSASPAYGWENMTLRDENMVRRQTMKAVHSPSTGQHWACCLAWAGFTNNG